MDGTSRFGGDSTVPGAVATGSRQVATAGVGKIDMLRTAFGQLPSEQQTVEAVKPTSSNRLPLWCSTPLWRMVDSKEAIVALRPDWIMGHRTRTNLPAWAWRPVSLPLHCTTCLSLFILLSLGFLAEQGEVCHCSQLLFSR